MPQRRLPKSVTALLKAMYAGKTRKDSAPLIIPYSAGTITKLDLFYPAFKLKVEAMHTALTAQSNSTQMVINTRQIAEWTISDFFTALQNAIRRKKFPASVRGLYGLDVSDGKIPKLNTEDDIDSWGEQAAVGEAARVAAGGAPITFPSIGEVTTSVTNFTNANLAQADAKDAYDVAQEAVEADLPEANKLVLKMWNETEAAFDTGDKPSLRRKCRDWGVVYVPNPGETPSPDDFSIIGTITDSASGLPIEDADLSIMPGEEVVLTDSHGHFYVAVLPAGSYNVTIHKAGYLEKTIPGVIVTAGAITTLNATLATAAGTGTISGNVNAPGFPPATVSVAGTGLTATTDAMGNFVITGVTPGTVSLQCFLNSDPANIKTQTPTIIAGATTTVSFSFP